MTQTKGFTDELLTTQDLDKLGAPQGEGLPTSLVRLNQHLDAPLRLSQTFPTADAVLNISPNQVERGDGASTVSGPRDDTLPLFPASTINWSTGATTGGTFKVNNGAFSLPGGTIGQFRRFVFVYRAADNVVDIGYSAEAASVAALADPGSIFATLDGDPIGYIDLEVSTGGSVYKTAGSSSDVIENKVGSESRIFRVAASGGGSGGSGGTQVDWQSLPGIGPVAAIETNVPVYLFEAAGSNKLLAYLTVPKGHSPSRQVKMKVSIFSPSTANAILIQATTYLIQQDSDPLDDTDNAYPSGNSALANVATANAIRQVELNLTDSSGQINSLSAAPGDVLRVELSRGTDSDAADLRMVPSLTEVSF